VFGLSILSMLDQSVLRSGMRQSPVEEWVFTP
jgi:hypothetical protein